MNRDELLRLFAQAKESGWLALDISGYAIRELPPEIGQLTDLTDLYLDDNQLSGGIPRVVAYPHSCGVSSQL